MSAITSWDTGLPWLSVYTDREIVRVLVLVRVSAIISGTLSWVSSLASLVSSMSSLLLLILSPELSSLSSIKWDKHDTGLVKFYGANKEHLTQFIIYKASCFEIWCKCKMFMKCNDIMMWWLHDCWEIDSLQFSELSITCVLGFDRLDVVGEVESGLDSEYSHWVGVIKGGLGTGKCRMIMQELIFKAG